MHIELPGERRAHRLDRSNLSRELQGKEACYSEGGEECVRNRESYSGISCVSKGEQQPWSEKGMVFRGSAILEEAEGHATR